MGGPLMREKFKDSNNEFLKDLLVKMRHGIFRKGGSH